MSHLTTSANTKTDAGAPGATGTSPGQDIGTDEVQDQTNTYKEPKHSNGHADKSTKSEKSECHHKTHHEEKHSKNDSKDLLNTPSEIMASTKMASGAPGATGASPMEPFGSDETRDESPKLHDHHKHHDHSHKQEGHSSEKNSSAPSKAPTESKISTPSKSSGETDPGMSANAKSPAGSGGPTGTAPMEPIGSDKSRDDSPNTRDHHQHRSHSHSSKTKSLQAENEGTPIKNSKAIPFGVESDSSEKPSSKENEGASITKNEAMPVGTESSAKPSSSTEDLSSATKNSKDEFDGSNASFTAEIGSKEDPGRIAEKKMYEHNAQHGDVGSMGVKQNSITGGGQYDVLKSEEAA